MRRVGELRHPPTPAQPEATGLVSPCELCLNIAEAQVVHEDGVIVSASPGVKGLLGYEPEDVIGTSIYELGSPEMRELMRERITAGWEGTYECPVRKKGGEYVELEVTVAERIVSGRRLRIVAARDVTEKKEAERRLQEALDSLEQQVRERTSELEGKNNRLEQEVQRRRLAERALEAANQRLDAERSALQDKNVALNELLSHIDTGKKQLAEEIRANVDRIALPILGMLEDHGGAEHRHLVGLLRNCLLEMTSPFVHALESLHAVLSPREIEVCNMIRSGFSTKDIAAMLRVSPQTVFTQRKQIRRKLKLSGEDTNLMSYLRSLDRGPLSQT